MTTTINNTTRYNVIGYYPKHNGWCLICLGHTNKEQMIDRMNDVRNNPRDYGINPNDVTEYKLDPINDDDNWWDKDTI